MITRRDVLLTAGVSAAAATLPGLATTPRMMTRSIPTTQEPLGVIGLGNSKAFSSDMAVTRELLSLLTEYGGSYVDAQRQARFNILENAPANSSLFMGTYVNGADVERDEKAIINLRQLRGGVTEILRCYFQLTIYLNGSHCNSVPITAAGHIRSR